MTTKVSTRLPISYEKLEAFCRKWNIVRLELFGSVLRDDFDPKRSNSLGLQIVESLAREDLGGRFTLTSGERTRATVTFPR